MSQKADFCNFHLVLLCEGLVGCALVECLYMEFRESSLWVKARDFRLDSVDVDILRYV